VEFVFEGGRYRLSKQFLSKARERARRSRLPHNKARQVFAREVIGEVTRIVTGRLGADPLGGGNLMGRADIDDLRRDVRSDPEVRAIVARLWPVLAPQQLLSDLYASRRLLDEAGQSITAAERHLLHREPGAEWTDADVPLLDEAAELLRSFFADRR